MVSEVMLRRSDAKHAQPVVAQENCAGLSADANGGRAFCDTMVKELRERMFSGYEIFFCER